MNSISLSWKNFSVKVDKVRDYFKATLSSNYDGLLCNEQNLFVVFKSAISTSDADAVQAYWDQITEASFQPTLQEIIQGKVSSASTFGQNMIVSAAVENIALGITQAGKTKEVSDYCDGLQRYLQTGSLYAAIQEIDNLIAAVPPASLSPFITVERLNSYRAKITAFLGI